MGGWHFALLPVVGQPPMPRQQRNPGSDSRPASTTDHSGETPVYPAKRACTPTPPEAADGPVWRVSDWRDVFHRLHWKYPARGSTGRVVDGSVGDDQPCIRDDSEASRRVREDEVGV